MNKKIINWIYNNKFYLIIAIVEIIILYINLTDIGIRTHDEMSVIVSMKYSDIKTMIIETLHTARWGWVISSLSQYVQFKFCSDMYTYRLFTVIGLLIPSIACSAILYKYQNKRMAWSFFYLFFLLMGFHGGHSGVVSFGWSYQYAPIWLCISIAFFLIYINERKVYFDILSILFYFLAMMQYEAFIPYGIIFFYFSLKDSGIKKIPDAIRDVLGHFFAALLYVFIYFYNISVAGKPMGDAMINASGYSMGQRIKALVGDTLFLFPISKNKYETAIDCLQHGGFDFMFFLKLFIVIGICFIVCRELRLNNKTINLWQYITVTIVLMIGGLTGNALLVLNDAFVNNYYAGDKGFGTSYFSYYFIVLWIIYTFVFLKKIVKNEKIYMFISVLIMVSTVGTMYLFNYEVAKSDDLRQQKYEILYNAIEKNRILDYVEEDSYIYMPQYSGIHNSDDLMTQWFVSASGKNIHFVNDLGNVKKGSKVYKTEYDITKNVLYLGKMKNKNYANEIILSRMEEGDIAIFAKLQGVNNRIDNGQSVIFCDDTALFSIEEMRKGVSIVQCNDLYFDSINILTEGIQNELLSGYVITLAGPDWNGNKFVKAGLANNEELFTWTDGKELVLNPVYSDNNNCYNIKLSINGTLGEQKLIFCVNGERVDEIYVNGPCEVETNIETKDSVSNFSIQIPNAEHVSSGDPRMLGVQLREISIIPEETLNQKNEE